MLRKGLQCKEAAGLFSAGLQQGFFDTSVELILRDLIWKPLTSNHLQLEVGAL